MLKINYIKLREKGSYAVGGSQKPYHIADVSFEIGNEQFMYSFAVFGEGISDILPKIKKEVGNYLIHQLFEAYDAMELLKS